MPLWSAIFYDIQEIPDSSKDAAYKFYNKHIKPNLIIEDKVIERKVKEALDILNLPFWKHRWHTYEIWCTISVLKALREFQPKPRVVNGGIALDDYSAEIVADLEYTAYENACVAIQQQTPVSSGSKVMMMPDLRVCCSDVIDEVNNTVPVIEFKQRATIDKSHVEEVALRYTSGTPNSGGTIIINYDKTNTAPTLLPNSYYIEEVLPGNLPKLDLLQTTIVELLKSIHFDRQIYKVVLIDVSSSMGEAYSTTEFKNVYTLLQKHSNLSIYFFNNQLMSASSHPDNFISTYGGTDLKTALKQLFKEVSQINKLLIISDMDYDVPNYLLNDIKFKECTPETIAANLP